MQDLVVLHSLIDDLIIVVVIRLETNHDCTSALWLHEWILGLPFRDHAVLEVVSDEDQDSINYGKDLNYFHDRDETRIIQLCLNVVQIYVQGLVSAIIAFFGLLKHLKPVCLVI